jgi:hypothetical protein
VHLGYSTPHLLALQFTLGTGTTTTWTTISRSLLQDTHPPMPPPTAGGTQPLGAGRAAAGCCYAAAGWPKVPPLAVWGLSEQWALKFSLMQGQCAAAVSVWVMLPPTDMDLPCCLPPHEPLLMLPGLGVASPVCPHSMPANPEGACTVGSLHAANPHAQRRVQMPAGKSYSAPTCRELPCAGQCTLSCTLQYQGAAPSTHTTTTHALPALTPRAPLASYQPLCPAAGAGRAQQQMLLANAVTDSQAARAARHKKPRSTQSACAPRVYFLEGLFHVANPAPASKVPCAAWLPAALRPWHVLWLGSAPRSCAEDISSQQGPATAQGLCQALQQHQVLATNS